MNNKSGKFSGAAMARPDQVRQLVLEVLVIIISHNRS